MSKIAGCLKCKWPVKVQIVKSSLKAAILLSHRKVITDSAELDCVDPWIIFLVSDSCTGFFLIEMSGF